MFQTNGYTRSAAGLVLGLALAMPAFAQKPLDFLFGGMPPKETTGQKLAFRINEMSGIQLVPREAGSTPNQHPVTVSPDLLRQQLSSVRITLPKGTVEPLFGENEVNELSEVLAKALAAAGPQDDLLLLSTSRRDGSYFTPPVALAARLFVANGQLNLLLADPRIEFYGRWRASNIRPEFTYPTRATATGKARLQTTTGAGQRADWAQLSLVSTTPVVPATPPVVPIGTTPAPVPVAPAPAAVAAPAPAPAPVPVAAPAPQAAPAAVAPPPAAAPTDAEGRLRTLKRLRDTGLISEDEYQQKRGEILRTL